MQLGKSFKNIINSYKWSNFYSLLHCIFTIFLSAVSYYLSTEYWYFSWIALLLLCTYALKGSLVSTFLTGFFSYLFGSSNPHAVLPLTVYWPLIVINATAFASVLAIFRHIAVRWRGGYTSFVFASGLTAYEFIASLYSPHGAVNSIAYTQVSNLSFIQIASITGIWGITFLMALLPSSIALTYLYPQNRRLSIKANLISLSLLLFVILFGFYRLHTPVEGANIKIGIASISTNLEQYLVVATNRDKQQVADTIQRYIQKIDFLAQSGVEVVLLPEKIITIETHDDNFQRLSNAAQKNKVNLIVGVTRKDKMKLYNSSYVFSPLGEVLLKYDKKHLLSAFESRYTPGTDLGIIGKWGIEICKDMDFTQPSLDYSRQGVNIVFVPALDFHDDGWSHARVAIMRGVEGNYAVARAGQWGLLTLSDSRGRIIEMVSSDVEDGGSVLVGEVRLGKGNSIYSKLGDSFAWICLGTFIILCIFLSLRKPNELLTKP
ncbi:nitrilase-related carbon-nitrogen hydrolase [Pelosinus baikalensis]|uniref:Nitrilase n=1 Tax=Pelosinus baikalensis TaxID=2892015 RepID=A0ABS8I0H3_9FIRM|nr:nitrilase-related carbon-nitrogen hydrolase [Pelosinus baikalensis]MCC5468299.1 nitrilase [Pelosinus baikalensis]